MYIVYIVFSIRAGQSSYFTLLENKLMKISSRRSSAVMFMSAGCRPCSTFTDILILLPCGLLLYNACSTVEYALLIASGRSLISVLDPFAYTIVPTYAYCPKVIDFYLARFPPLKAMKKSFRYFGINHLYYHFF
jgi:hypothetical protein